MPAVMATGVRICEMTVFTVMTAPGILAMAPGILAMAPAAVETVVGKRWQRTVCTMIACGCRIDGKRSETDGRA